MLVLTFVFIYAGTHISNTREAKAFALISEEGIAKGVRRVTAVTADCAFEAIDLARSLEQEVLDASQIDEKLLEKVTVHFIFHFFNILGVEVELLGIGYIRLFFLRIIN